MTDVNVSPNQKDVIIEIVVSLKGTGVKYLNRLAQQRSDDTTRHSYPCCCRRKSKSYGLLYHGTIPDSGQEDGESRMFDDNAKPDL